MSRSASSFNRSKPRFKPQPAVLVICEDKKSGLRYLKDASHHFRVQVTVEIIHCGNTDPKGIVTDALKKEGKYDNVFCAIDSDSHLNFEEACQLAEKSTKVRLIRSYPCFEFWLLLHFKNSRKPYTAAGNKSAADVLISELRTCPGMEDYAKGDKKSIFESLLGDRFAEARRIAPGILADAKACGQMNPSTELHELLDFFEKLSTPQLK